MENDKKEKLWKVLSGVTFCSLFFKKFNRGLLKPIRAMDISEYYFSSNQLTEKKYISA